MSLAADAASPVITLNITRSNGFYLGWSSVAGSTYSIQSKTNVFDPWMDATDVPNGFDATNNLVGVVFPAGKSSMRIFRVLLNPVGMARIPAGEFMMGDSSGDAVYRGGPVHPVFVSAFYMDRAPVAKKLWDSVINYATNHGYSFTHLGEAQGPNHPVVTISWYDCVKWCNARSEFEGLSPAYFTDLVHQNVYRTGERELTTNMVAWRAGYRLPTEAEFEKGARGGLVGKRFPLGDSISQSQANYFAMTTLPYDVSGLLGYHPIWSMAPTLPYTNPSGTFPANGYGLEDMDGNVANWCWDKIRSYPTGREVDPKGDDSFTVLARVRRGGNWYGDASEGRCAMRLTDDSGAARLFQGFRTVLPAE